VLRPTLPTGEGWRRPVELGRAMVLPLDALGAQLPLISGPSMAATRAACASAREGGGGGRALLELELLFSAVLEEAWWWWSFSASSRRNWLSAARNSAFSACNCLTSPLLLDPLLASSNLALVAASVLPSARLDRRASSRFLRSKAVKPPPPPPLLLLPPPLPMTTRRQRAPNCRVKLDSSAVGAVGQQVTTRAVRHWDWPRQPCSKYVSFELRYGTNLAFWSRASMTSPSAAKLLLMCWASLRDWPLASDCFTRSDPAKSTRCSLAAVEAPPSIDVVTSTMHTCSWCV